ncbi:hypothetical protein pb186bvf_015139 [Paramecium bursaria]
MDRTSYSRFGKRLDQQKQQQSFRSNSPPVQVSPKTIKKTQTGTDWIFRRVDRNTPVTSKMGYVPADQMPQRVYNPQYNIIEKHIPIADFSKQQIKERSVSVIQEIKDFDFSKTYHVRLPIAFEKQIGRKEQVSRVIDTFYNTSTQSRNRAHSFDSYSNRKPLSEKEVTPDYECLNAWKKTQTKVQAFDFSKIVSRNNTETTLKFKI